jgi:hypothetical protein
MLLPIEKQINFRGEKINVKILEIPAIRALDQRIKGNILFVRDRQGRWVFVQHISSIEDGDKHILFEAEHLLDVDGNSIGLGECIEYKSLELVFVCVKAD